MKPLYSLAILILGLTSGGVQAQEHIPVAAQQYEAGLSTLTVLDDRRDRGLEGLIWYPTDAAEPRQEDFESAVWVGAEVIRDADAAPGPFPLIVLSHGMFGNARNQAWFAAKMARRGFVVAAVDHPGTSTWSRDADQRRALWERPGDIIRLIDFAVMPGSLPVQVDPDQVFMAGHSLGGFTALALAGARYDAQRLEQFCDTAPGELACGIFADWQIAQTPEDREQMQADLADERIRAFAIFDLGGTQSFSDESLNKIDRPLLVFGAPIMNSGLTLDIESRALVKELPSETFRYIEPATLSHFDFFNLCKPAGYEILLKELPGDEVVCENGGAHRADMHNLILDEVTAFFVQVLQ
ncbi:alpha/beta fold hydrolase [Phaeobacter sp. HF9A]|uniref:alpha/beta hydrolase family protein n=1 Tax=Phaeobacter sp. HF9A TaxID=2721561 RepID=UPI00142FAFD5|nr:alpha/beta fold hydrolase [Phaeobacter sp. HF9A]NIZ13017.1 alpha/beta fold hydrolase [Phaeobacter sp. HF9A]